LEDSRVDFDLLYTWPVEFFQGCDDSSLFPCTGWTVYEKMGEVTALGLEIVSQRGDEEAAFIPVSGDAQKDLCGKLIGPEI
jgi:hypothetical protein